MKANKNIAGETCPGCNGEIFLGEEIKICPKCYKPHHFSCYEKDNCSNGACANDVDNKLDVPRPPSSSMPPPPDSMEDKPINKTQNDYSAISSSNFSSGSSTFQPSNFDIPNEPDRNPSPGEKVKPCRWCGEDIQFNARKCRYCNEFQSDFDRENHAKSGGTADDGELLSVGDKVVAVLCPCLGIIAGIMWTSQGKTKGSSMVKWAVISMIVQGVLRGLGS